MLLSSPNRGLGLSPMFRSPKPIPAGMQPGVTPLVWQAVVGGETQGMIWVAVNIGLKLFRTPVTNGVLYFSMLAFSAVLWVPNQSETNPRRGAQFLKQPRPF